MRTQSLAIVLLLSLPAVPASAQDKRFKFKIDPATPLQDLLPARPITPNKMPPLVFDDLSVVPEVGMGHVISRDQSTDKALEQTAHFLAKINHLNQKKRDGYMEALLARRADLSGLPFVMGDDCRVTSATQRHFFKPAAELAHATITDASRRDTRPDKTTFRSLWQILNRATEDAPSETANDVMHRRAAIVAALMQVFAIEPAAYRVELARFLTHFQCPDAAKALAKLAIFSPEEDVRSAAIAGLKKHDAKQYTSVLMSGLEYPQTPVPRRAAEALVKLERKDLTKELVAALDRPDPRSPVEKTVDGAKVHVVRELVRINHHRNCWLCHAPAVLDELPSGTLTAPVPLPTQSLQPPADSYRSTSPSPDILVRIDTTYLRQDFSVMMRVPDAKPWPELQRFDFLVRSRQVSATEAAERAAQLAKLEPSHRQAALHALRSLTGYDAGATAEAWRSWLKAN